MTYRGRHRSGLLSRRALLIGGGVVGAGLIAGGVARRAWAPDTADRADAREPDARDGSAAGGTDIDDDLGAPVPEPSTEPFAHVHDLALVLPERKPLAVCYHEAVYPDAAELAPIGTCRRNANRTKFDPPPKRPGPPYIVMSARGRGTPATSAVDIVMRPRTPVLSPVTGRVAKVKRYRLYGGTPDLRVEIVPVDSPDMRVAMIHLDDLSIREGDQVSAGDSRIGVPRVFGFTSQVDYYIPGRNPHVHAEVKVADQGAQA